MSRLNAKHQGAFAPELDDVLKEQLTDFVIGIVMFLPRS